MAGAGPGGCRPCGSARPAARRRPAAGAGTRSNASARTWLACVSGVSRPSRRGTRSATRPAPRRPARVAVGVVVAAEQRGDPADQPGAVRVVGGRDVALVGRGEGVEVARGVVARDQPLPPVEAAVPRKRSCGAGSGRRATRRGAAARGRCARCGPASAPSSATARRGPARRRSRGTAPRARSPPRRPSRPSR